MRVGNTPQGADINEVMDVVGMDSRISDGYLEVPTIPPSINSDFLLNLAEVPMLNNPALEIPNSTKICDFRTPKPQHQPATRDPEVPTIPPLDNPNLNRV